MSRFSLLTSSALVAASLALAAPLPVLAQDAPAVTQAQTLIWTRVERFGVLVPIPEGAPVTDDVDTPEDRSFAVNTSEGSGPGIRVGIKVLLPSDLAELPVPPGEAGFDAFLARIGGVPVVSTGVVVQLGERALHAYGGSGTRTAPDGATVEARMLFLVAHDLDAQGQGLLVAFYAQGLDPEAAGQAEAEFASRLAVAPVAEAAPPQAAPDAPAVDAGAPPVVLIDGLAALALTSGDVIVRTESNRGGGSDLRLTNEQGQLLRVMAVGPDATLIDSLRRLLERVDSVEPGEAGGQPVWIVRAASDRQPIGVRAEGLFPMTLVIPQYCIAGDGILAVAVISDPGLEAAGQALLQGLTLSRPDGAEMCASLAALPDVLMAPREAVAPMPTPAPLPPVAEAPATPSAEPPQTVGMMGDLVTLTLAASDRVTGIDDFNGTTDVGVLTAQGVPARLLAGPLTSSLADTVSTLLHRVDTIDAFAMAGQPVWMLSGPSRATLNYGDAPISPAFPARLIVPQACIGGQPAYVVILVAEPGQDAALDRLLDGLAPGVPAGSVACQTTIDAMLAPPSSPPSAETISQPPQVQGDHGKLPLSVAGADQGASGMDDELALWAEVVSQNQPQGYWTYLKAYPDGQFVELAQVMLQAPVALPQPVAPPPAQVPVQPRK